MSELSAHSRPPALLALNCRRLVFGLTVVASALLFISMTITLLIGALGSSTGLIQKMEKAFSVDLELNVPAFFSCLLLLMASALLSVITYFKSAPRSNYRFHWALLAFGFLFMAFDEIASIHEKLIEPMRRALGGHDLGIFHFAWVVPALALLAILAVIFVRFWWNLPAKTRMLCLIAAVLYLGGAIGMELLDGKYAGMYGRKTMSYGLLSLVEEALEMAGTIVFISALLDYIACNYPRIRIDFEKTEETRDDDQLSIARFAVSDDLPSEKAVSLPLPTLTSHKTGNSGHLALYHDRTDKNLY